VALRALSGGGLHLQIAIRSLRSGEVVAVASDLDVDGGPEEFAAVEAALSYAEGMGFLFDEDEVVSGDADSAEKAAASWCDLVEEVPERVRAQVSAESHRAPPAPEASDSLLEVPVRETHSDVEKIAVEFDRPTDHLVAASSVSVLTKFRICLGGNDRVGGAIVAGPPQESRIRLLSRY